MRYFEDIVVGQVIDHGATYVVTEEEILEVGEAVFSFENASLVECRPTDGAEVGE